MSVSLVCRAIVPLCSFSHKYRNLFHGCIGLRSCRGHTVLSLALVYCNRLLCHDTALSAGLASSSSSYRWQAPSDLFRRKGGQKLISLLSESKRWTTNILLRCLLVDANDNISTKGYLVQLKCFEHTHRWKESEREGRSVKKSIENKTESEIERQRWEVMQLNTTRTGNTSHSSQQERGD